MRYYYTIILCNKKRLIPFLVIIALTFLNMYEISIQDPIGIHILNKNLLLYPNEGIPTGYKYLTPFFWLLPLYVTIFIGDFLIEEKKNSYNEIVKLKQSKSKKKTIEIAGSFSLGFLLVVIPMILNLIVTYIFLGSFEPIEGKGVLMLGGGFFQALLGIINIGIISGVISLTAFNLSGVVQSKSQLNIILFLLYFFLITNPSSISVFNLMQIFSCSSFLSLFSSYFYIFLYFVVINLAILSIKGVDYDY